MSKFKKITFLWLLFISIFLIFNFLVFFNYTSKVYPDTADTTIGDLARMSYMVDIIQERENIVDLEKLHISQNEYKNETIDVLTIGDSFSNGGAGGTAGSNGGGRGAGGTVGTGQYIIAGQNGGKMNVTINNLVSAIAA